MTYKEAYTEYLRNRLNAGGSPEEMEEAVTEFNSVERVAWVGSPAFAKWTEARRFICENCDRRFELEPGNPVEIESTVRCPACVKREG